VGVASTAALRTLADLARRAPRRGLRAAQWYFLLFALLCIASAAAAVLMQPAAAPVRAAGLAFLLLVAAVRIAEYRRGRPLAWPVDLVEITGLVLLVSALTLQPARSMLFGCLMVRAVIGRIGRVLTLQLGFIAVVLGAFMVQDLDRAAVAGDITGMVLSPIALFLLRALLQSGEVDRDRQHRLLSTLLYNLPTGVLVADLTGRPTLVNQALRRLLHWPDRAEAALPLAGTVPLSAADGTAVAAGDRPLARALNGETSREAEYVLGTATGERRHVVINAEPLAGTDGERLGAVVTVLDVTQQHHQQLRLDHLTEHDPLTGLPNRHHLRRRIGTALGRETGPVTVLQIGLDRFKPVNESLGRQAGDQVLIVAASRIREALGAADSLARLDGDEFAVVLAPADTGRVQQVVAGITARLSQPIWLGDRPVRCGASIGIATATTGDPDDVLRDADLAMYAAKSTGGNQARTFTPALRAQMSERVRLEDELRDAVHRGDLIAHFQPIIDLATGRARAVEALARWPHPRLGMVPPDQFIPLAESSGLIDALGESMLRQSCDRLASAPGCTLDVSVNVAPAQLRTAAFPDMVLAVLAETGVGPHRLILEITESMLTEDGDVLAHLRRLRQHGVRIAVDDFGTGYSCLARLDTMPVDILKIDKSLLHRAGPLRSAPLVDAAIALAHGLGLRAVVEGVETVEQSDYLRERGCDSAQGYLYARPVAWADLPVQHIAELAAGPV
jgi:diguanylate cyclase (GGDEF)-like protein